ncbi:MAG TPA: sulfocyanin-like copper-binding protein [Acidimicrobiia bacterium]|nr:sulfocyanin-like copper-binding protein [Acidimicrobiia bacterium]
MRRLLAMTVVTLLLAGCGSSGGTTTTQGATGPQSVSVTMEDYFFAPESVTVAAGATVNVTGDNPSGTDHTWTVLTAGDEVSTAIGLPEERILFQVYGTPGSSAVGSFVAPGPGIYQIICTISGHVELGMTGTLIVSG